MTDVASLALKVDSTQVVTADKNLTGFAGAAKDAGTAATKATGKFGAMKGATSQLSFQLQDIAVQAQMGTSAFTILAQQGPQIASAFGPGGAVLGAIIGVAGAISGVLFTSLMDTSSLMEEARDAADDLGDSYDDLVEDVGSLTAAQREFIALKSQDEISKAKIAIAEMNKEIIEQNALVRLWSARLNIGAKGAAETLSEVKLEAAQTGAAIDGLNDSIKENEKRFKLATGAIRVETKTQEDVRKNIERQEKSIQDLIDRYDTLTVSTSESRAEAIRYSAAVKALEVDNEELAESLVSTAETYAQSLEKQEQLKEEQKEAAKTARDLEREHVKLTDSISSGLADAIQGYKTFGDVVLNVLDDIAAALIQKNITDPLVDIFSGAVSGGGSESSGGFGDILGGIGDLFSFNAKGGVINSPSIVGTQNGKLAVGGEAGEEAVLPLRRGANGDLGVQASGMGGSNVVVNVINESGAETSVSESQGADGERIVNVTVLKAVKNALSTGTLDRDFKANFGLTRQGT